MPVIISQINLVSSISLVRRNVLIKKKGRYVNRWLFFFDTIYVKFKKCILSLRKQMVCLLLKAQHQRIGCVVPRDIGLAVHRGLLTNSIEIFNSLLAGGHRCVSLCKC